jgi:hypothetical protein
MGDIFAFWIGCEKSRGLMGLMARSDLSVAEGMCDMVMRKLQLADAVYPDKQPYQM